MSCTKATYQLPHLSQANVNERIIALSPLWMESKTMMKKKKNLARSSHWRPLHQFIICTSHSLTYFGPNIGFFSFFLSYLSRSYMIYICK